MLSTPEYDWELNVNEGSTVLYHGDKVHIIYSANGSWTQDYCLGKLTATKGCDYLDKSNWTKSTTAVFSKRAGAYGPGHCSFTKDYTGEYDLICYHATTNASEKWVNRFLRYQPVAWHGDEPVLGAPRPITRTTTTDALDLTADWSPSTTITNTLVSLPYAQSVTYNGSAQSPKATTN